VIVLICTESSHQSRTLFIHSVEMLGVQEEDPAADQINLGLEGQPVDTTIVETSVISAEQVLDVEDIPVVAVKPATVIKRMRIVESSDEDESAAMETEDIPIAENDQALERKSYSGSDINLDASADMTEEAIEKNEDLAPQGDVEVQDLGSASEQDYDSDGNVVSLAPSKANSINAAH
jgi:hypothetical protein